jgi:hypothetical protein
MKLKTLSNKSYFCINSSFWVKIKISFLQTFTVFN